MRIERRVGVVLLLLCLGISVRWDFPLGWKMPGGPTDFQSYYYGTQCLIHRHNPYDVNELEALYRTENGIITMDSDSIQRRKTITLYVNLPATFLFIAPFAMLPLMTAQVLWATLTAGFFFLASFLIWQLASNYAPILSTCLIALFLANCELVFSTGNAVGIVVGLCVIGTWCFIEERFVLAGILCMAVSLSIKPHDAGLVWLYFFMGGGVYRRRALQALVVAAALALPAVLWVSLIAPAWIQDWQANMMSIVVPGAVNNPGPTSLGIFYLGGVISLQTVVSLFGDAPLFYNTITYSICGAMLAVWLVRTVKSGVSQTNSWLALAAIAPITMIVTYHRSYDAKLLLLTVPACAILWDRGGRIKWIAVAINTAGLVLTADYPLTLLMFWARNSHIPQTGVLTQLFTVAQLRPAPLILLVMSVFYLWFYIRPTGPDKLRRPKKLKDLVAAIE